MINSVEFNFRVLIKHTKIKQHKLPVNCSLPLKKNKINNSQNKMLTILDQHKKYDILVDNMKLCDPKQHS